jgi:accessory gene regulator protein AgrB
MARKKKELTLFDIVLMIVLLIIAYEMLMHLSWFASHVLQPIFKLLFGNSPLFKGWFK